MKDRVGHIAFNLLQGTVRLLPRRWVLALGGCLGSLAFYADARHRGLALHNLRRAFGPDLGPRRTRKIARESFRHFGRLSLDVLKLASFDPDRLDGLLSVEGGEHLTEALEKGRGALVATAHFGNWEAGIRILSRFGKLNVIARRLDNPYLERELSRVRRRLGARIIYKQLAARPILQALKANEMVAILVDQNVLRREGVFVDFFGRPASTTPAPAALSLRSGAPIIPAFCTPLPGGRYHGRILPPLEPPSGLPAEDAVLKITQTYTKMMETEIRRRPGLWLWFHDRWRTRPVSENESQEQD